MRFACAQVKHFDCFMILGGEKQALALEIQREMVEIARKTGQRSSAHQLQGRLFLRNSHGCERENER